MDAEIKAEWVEALRSGEYQQGRNALRRVWSSGEVSYCCLGVLCELFSRKGEGKWNEEEFLFGEPDGRCGNGSTGILPRNLAKQVGLKDRNPILINQGKSLAELNDSHVSFAEIADLIEAEL